ncbi:MAG: Ig-like domain repeat protein, partial [Methanosphaera sp.]|nr:Ig-like domain repeat protein [Methanosphaera sp.]
GSNGAVDTFTVKNNNITDGILLSGKRNNQVKNVIIENNIINSDDEYAVNVNRTVTNVTIKNNRINSTDKVGNDAVLVKNEGKDVTILNNSAPQKTTEIVLNNVASSVYANQNITFTGTFKVEGKAAKATKIGVYDNNSKLTDIETNDNGVFNYTYKTSKTGQHNISFRFAQNDTLYASNASKTITVNSPIATSITLTGDSSVYCNENLVISGTFKANNAAVKVNSIDVYDGSTKLATVTSGNDGKFNYTFKSATVGSHNLVFKFAGNVSHQASNATKTVTVNKIPTSITVVANPTSVYLTENIAFNATFKANNAAVKVNSIDVYDGSTKLATVGPSANNGVVSYTYTAAKAGSHDITFKFAGNATHLASEATKTITVKDPATTSITLTSDRTSVYLTEKANITGTFKEGNKAIKVDSITVTDNGKQVATVGPSGSDGVFNYIFDGTAAGNHNLTFKFAGNVSHNASQSSIIINVDAPNATSIQLTTNASELFVDQTAKLDALFTLAGQSTGTYVEEIAITDNGEQIATVGPSSDGKLTYEYQAKEIGNHEITFKFAGNVSHVASEYTINILVKEPDATQITLTSDKDSLYVDQTAKLDAEFAYADQSTGTYVESITIADNGEQIATVGPLDDGKVTYDYVASEVGIHEITFSFAGNNTHAPAESTINIEVKAPDATEIQLTVDGETEFNESESSVISGVFKYANEDEGTYVDLITICEDDVEIATAGPSDDGTFTYTYTPQKPGDHVLTFSFAGNNTHAAAESSINYHIRGYVLKVDTTEFIKGQPATIQASIYFEGQVSEDINKGKVAFKVNGKTLKDESGKTIYAKIVNGVAKIEDYVIPESWADGNYSIQAVSTASSQSHALKSELSTLNVHEEEDPTIEEPQLTTEDVTATIGTPVTLKATLTDNGKQINEGKVLFKVNGKTLKDESGKVIYAKIVNNEAVLEYTFPESWKLKDYTITAMLISSDYPRLEANSTLTLSD